MTAGPRVRVLVADDDGEVARVVAEFLDRAGFEAAAVTEAPRLLGALRALRPDVLLQDVRMPGLDLAAHVAAIRADPALRGTAVVLCSATMELDDLARELRADGTLEKPFRGDRLVAYLEAFSAARKTPRP